MAEEFYFLKIDSFPTLKCWSLILENFIIPDCHIQNFLNFGMLNKINKLIELCESVEIFEGKENFVYLFEFIQPYL